MQRAAPSTVDPRAAMPLDFARRCQKPDAERIGNWMARRVSRPAALRITRIVAPWGVSANMATLTAWACGLLAAVALGTGTAWGWLAGAAVLQLWYLLDHVDGQLARLHRTDSLDGVQLDYLMHHTVHLVVPLAAGYGLFAATNQRPWLLVGLAWGLGMLLLGLHHDVRYKAFVVRLKRLRGALEVCGGGGGRPQPPTPAPRGLWKRLHWTACKTCEIHVTMNLLSLLALAQVFTQDDALLAGRCFTAAMAGLSLALAALAIVRSQARSAVEKEFAAWYRPRPGHTLTCVEGWWQVELLDDGGNGKAAGFVCAAGKESS